MYDEFENTIIYPKPDNTKLPEKCVIRPIINPKQYLDFELPEIVCSTILASYNNFSSGMERIDKPNNKICQTPIYRIRNYDINFAKYLSDALATSLPAQLTLNKNSRVDWLSDNPDEYNVWNLIGVSPYFRYLQYNVGSEEYPHYDNTYKAKEDPLTRTLLSGIIYLTDHNSGATAFIDDKQFKIPFTDRKYDQWDTQAKFDDIYEWAIPKRGKMIVYPHGECHSVMPNLDPDPRIVIRFDVFYSAFSKK